MRTEIAATYSEYDASGMLHGLDPSCSDWRAQAYAHLLLACTQLTGTRLGVSVRDAGVTEAGGPAHLEGRASGTLR